MTIAGINVIAIDVQAAAAACAELYFLQQYLNMYMAFPESNTDQIDIRFFSLFFEDGAIKAEMADTISELQHNSIMEEFDAIYNREQGFIYERIRE